MSPPRVAIVDYGLGNLFSVAQACEHAGIQGFVSSARDELRGADAVILPGVGAFGDAMATLRALDLVGPLQELASSAKPLVGICLGMQLLMSESSEFGRHEGLGIVEGSVRRLSGPAANGASADADETLKVPQVGWNRVYGVEQAAADAGSLLRGLPEGVFMYFVHSYFVEPADPGVVTTQTRYGNVDFCSSLRSGNVIGFQFHPERSGEHGLRVYRNLAAWLEERA